MTRDHLSKVLVCIQCRALIIRLILLPAESGHVCCCSESVRFGAFLHLAKASAPGTGQESEALPDPVLLPSRLLPTEGAPWERHTHLPTPGRRFTTPRAPDCSFPGDSLSGGRGSSEGRVAPGPLLLFSFPSVGTLRPWKVTRALVGRRARPHAVPGQ